MISDQHAQPGVRSADAEPRPSLLIISFSPIASDARVLRQVSLFTPLYDVTTIGYGPAPAGVVEHLSIPTELRQDKYNPKLVLLRLYALIHAQIPAVRWTRRALSGRRFDVVFANEYETVPVARKVARLGVHADLHEYSPRLLEQHDSWRKRIAPYIRHVIRRHVRKADSWTTVSRGLAREYESEFGFRPEVVYNAAPMVSAGVTETTTPMRIVHSGAGLSSRMLERTIEAVIQAGDRFTLDLYLTANHPKYIDELRQVADVSHGRVRVLDPVPYAELAERLRHYDLGIFVLPPVNFNYEWSMPNKLFDFIQARLAVVVGPSPEMAEFVREHHIGRITEGYEVEDIVDALHRLDIEAIDAMKQASHALASVATADKENRVWAAAVARLMSPRDTGMETLR